MTDDQIDGLVPMPEPVDALRQEYGINFLGAVDVFTAEQLTAHTRAAVRAALEVQRQDLQNCLGLIWALGRELNCLPSTFSDSNGHILKAAIKLNAERDELRQEVERLTIDLEDAKRSEAGALNLVCRIRFAIGDNGARMQSELIKHLKQMRKEAEKYDAWQEAQRLVEEEMPVGYYVTLSMSPGDWSLGAYTDEGDEIRIDDYESTEQFIREAVEAAKAHHDRKDQTNA